MGKTSNNDSVARILSMAALQNGQHVVPDWQQNDLNAIDYIKNRPGGYNETKKVRVELWSGTTPAINNTNQKKFTVPVTTFDRPFSVVIDGVENIYTPIPRTINGNAFYFFGPLTEAEIDDFMASGEMPSHGYTFG